jgi:hypothetical protein
MKIRFAFLLLLVGATGMVSSCSKRPLNALNPCTINGVVQNVPVNPQRAVDLLFLIDDSTSMRDEQDKLQAQVPRLVNLLITGGQAEPAAVGEFPAVESLHVAIITPDLGYSTVPLTNFTPPQDFTPPGPPAECTAGGKAGFMQVDGNTGTPRQPCSAVTPPEGTLYLNFPEPGFNETDLISDVECLTGQDDGCGFEQQLEAILESDRNTANGGFNREDALLAIIMITDEDDCSSTDPRVFDTVITDGNPFQGPETMGGELQPNLRCWAHANALQPVQRYVEEVAKLKSDPSQIVFAAITGIPEDPALDDENFETDEDRYAAILAHPDMVERKPDGAAGDSVGTQLVPACTADDGSGSAAPGRRIVETMEGLASGGSGVGTVVEAICADDYAPALNAIVDRIAAALRQLCLPRPLNRDSANLVGCEVREVQPEGQTCADAGRGREPSAVGNEDGREVCRVTQLPSDPTAGIPSGEGWFYDDFTSETVNACSFNPEQQRVSFTSGAEPVSGARIRFECLQAAPPADADIGWPCINDSGCVTVECSADSEPDACMEAALNERYDRDNLMLACDSETNTCQLTCESDVQCPGGFACFDASGDGNQYCVNPTCALN